MLNNFCRTLLGLVPCFGLAGCGELLDKNSSATPSAFVSVRMGTDAPRELDDRLAVAIIWEPSDTLVALDCADNECGFPKNRYKGPAETIVDNSEWGACDGEVQEGHVEERLIRHGLEHLQSWLEFEADSPFSLEVGFFTVPPAEARAGLGAMGGSGFIATGRLIAYIDENGNKRFDHGTPEKPPEKGLAYSADHSLLRSAHFIHEGFTILYKDGDINLERVAPEVRALLKSVPNGYSAYVKKDGEGHLVQLDGSEELVMRSNPYRHARFFWCSETLFSAEFQDFTGRMFIGCDVTEYSGQSVTVERLGENYPKFGDCTETQEQARLCIRHDLPEAPENWESLIPESWYCNTTTFWTANP